MASVASVLARGSVVTMTDKELNRLRELDVRIREIAEEFGLLTTDINFEVVPAMRVIEGMAYSFPTNFAHWSHGRDYDKHRTIYEHTGRGIPYEQIWNFERPRAFLVNTNPFALNVLVIAHCYGHVDYFLGSRYLQHGRSFSDVANEARSARERFQRYEELYGAELVEKVLDCAKSIQWHQDPDPFAVRVPEEELREHLLEMEQAKLAALRSGASSARKKEREEEVQKIQQRIDELAVRTPPLPDYDLLGYIVEKSTKLKPWMRDVLTVIHNQARSLAPNARTKLLNEGWATYWHVQIMRRLFTEGLLTDEEHSVFNEYHANVTAPGKTRLNDYAVGWKFFEHVKERWDQGRFGREYEECKDGYRKARWDTGAMKGTEKIFEIRSNYSNRMAIEALFSDEFIHAEQIYIWKEEIDPQTGERVWVIAEDRPEVIRLLLKEAYTHYGTPLIYAEDGNFEDHGELVLRHEPTGYELDPAWANLTLDAIHFLWGRPLMLHTFKRQGKLGTITPEVYQKK